MAYIKVNGIQLFYAQQGKGEPLIFLHGNGEDHHTFDPLIAKLANHFTCYAIDSRNHGQSEMTDQFHYQTMMDDLYAFITAMQFEKVNIIGFSDGSIITMLLAMQHPKLVHQAILLGPNLKPSDFTDACTRYVERLYKNDPNPLYKMMLDEPNIEAEDLQNIQAKVLIIGGENDLYKAGTFEKIHENIQKSNLLILENHDHSSYIFQNDMIYADVINFLQ